jgi:lipid II:glycine glycyltransferase (peptidoglycan interpeptide bridge formation enzyme)
MVYIRLATNEDKDAWNNVADASLYSTYSHTWEWKEVLEQGLDVKSICLVAEDKGEIIGIFPGFLHPKFKEDQIRGVLKFMLGKAQILWSPFQLTWDYGGPCVLPKTPNKVFIEFLSNMEKLAKKNKAIDVRISPFTGDELKSVLLQNGYRISKRATSIIDLTKTEDDLCMGLKKETRSQIRQGKRYGLEVIEKNDLDGVNDFYECLKDVAHRAELYIPPKTFYEKLIKILIPKNMVRIQLVKHEGKTIGSGLTIYYKDMLVTRYWAAFSDYFKLRPYNVLIWNILVTAKENGYTKCDLGGLPADENNGIYRFKAGWRGEIQPIDWFVKDLKFETLRKLRRKK